MPATALTMVQSAPFGFGIADANFQAVDQANGNVFPNDGNTVFLLTRSGGSVNPTFNNIPASKYTLGAAAAKTPATPVLTTKIGFYGPFPPAIFGPTVTVGYDTGTSVTAAVVQLVNTPT